MGILLQFKIGNYIQNLTYYQKYVICTHTVDYCRPGHIMYIRIMHIEYTYTYSHTHIEYNHCRVYYVNTLPELFMEVADPELPSSKGVLSSLFGSHHSVVDHEELHKCYHLLYCMHICIVHAIL